MLSWSDNEAKAQQFSVSCWLSMPPMRLVSRRSNDEGSSAARRALCTASESAR